MHIERVLQHVDAEAIRRRKFRVALDAVNGAGSRMSCAFLRETLGCELHAISVDPDKPFPRIAEPRPTHSAISPNWSWRREAKSDSGRIPMAIGLAVVDETGQRTR